MLAENFDVILQLLEFDAISMQFKAHVDFTVHFEVEVVQFFQRCKDFQSDKEDAIAVE